MKMLAKQLWVGIILALCTLGVLGQTLPDQVKIPGHTTYVQHQPGAPDNVYQDAQGNLYQVSVQPMNSVSCDSGGCTVMTCQGGGNTSPCTFQRCDTTGCHPIKSGSTS
jgi:hypothetical protein